VLLNAEVFGCVVRWPTLKGASLLRYYYYIIRHSNSKRFRVDLYTWIADGGIGIILSPLEPVSKYWTQTYHRTMAPGQLDPHNEGTELAS
jgi:hypothetical protein